MTAVRRTQSSSSAVAKRTATRLARLDPLVRQMHADYIGGLSLHAVGNKYQRDRKSVRDLFVKRGLFVRTHKQVRHRRNGQFAALRPASRARLEAFIRGATRPMLPRWLQHEWRNWTFERRSWLVRRLWAVVDKRSHRIPRPTTPFSANVEPFDYTSLRAHNIADRMNKGLPSRHHKIHLQLGSRGVIYKGRLWFWNQYSYQLGPWDPQNGRPQLNVSIWEETNGRPLPAGHVVSFRDGNVNNYSPDNLYIRSRNDVCRANQAAALQRKSRAHTALLLSRSHSHENEDKQLHDQLRTARR